MTTGKALSFVNLDKGIYEFNLEYKTTGQGSVDPLDNS